MLVVVKGRIPLRSGVAAQDFGGIVKLTGFIPVDRMALPVGWYLVSGGAMRAARHIGQRREGASVLPEPSRHECLEVESEALAALQQGDGDRALTILMNGYGDAIYRYCRRMLGEASADDAHQVTFVHAYTKFATFRGTSSLRAWLYGIAHYRCLDVLRKERREALAADEPPETAAAPGADGALAARQVLTHCLPKLKAEVREVVVLRYLEELSFTEIAAICKKDPAAVQMRLARALPLLRRCVEANSR